MVEGEDVMKTYEEEEEEERTERPISNEASCVLTTGHQTLNQFPLHRSHTLTHKHTHTQTA